MTTKEIKREVLKLMDEKIGINMYAVLKGNQEKNVKMINTVFKKHVPHVLNRHPVCGIWHDLLQIL